MFSPFNLFTLCGKEDTVSIIKEYRPGPTLGPIQLFRNFKRNWLLAVFSLFLANDNPSRRITLLIFVNLHGNYTTHCFPSGSKIIWLSPYAVDHVRINELYVNFPRVVNYFSYLKGAFS